MVSTMLLQSKRTLHFPLSMAQQSLQKSSAHHVQCQLLTAQSLSHLANLKTHVSKSTSQLANSRHQSSVISSLQTLMMQKSSQWKQQHLSLKSKKSKKAASLIFLQHQSLATLQLHGQQTMLVQLLTAMF